MPQGDAVPPEPPVSTPTPTPAPRFLLRQRDPPTFAGNDANDVEDWIRLVERASNHNNWDPAMRLANVVFYLSGTALAWFENNEDRFDTWDTFKRLAIAAFGQGAERKQRALRYLQTRHQSYSEPFSSYMADVLNACRKVNSGMDEAEKICHLLKGLSQQLFNAVALTPFSTVAELNDACKRYDELQRQRIFPTTDLEPSTSRALPQLNLNHAELRMLIRDMIREELAVMNAGRPMLPSEERMSPDPVSSENALRKLVQAEVKNAVSIEASEDVPPPQRTYAEVCRASSHVVPSPMVAPVVPTSPPQQPFRPAYRQPLICFYCNMPGHIARRCYRRQHDMMQAPAWRPYRQGRLYSPYSSTFGPEYIRQDDGRASADDLDYMPEIRTPGQGQRRWNTSPSRPPRSPSPRASRRRSVSPLRPSMPKFPPSN